MNKLLDSLHEKILRSDFAKEVTEAEINALIEAKNDDWIPVNSGILPKKEGTDVWITLANGEVEKAKFHWFYSSFKNGIRDGNGETYWENDDNTYYNNQLFDEVKAWMPCSVPAPYIQQ